MAELPPEGMEQVEECMRILDHDLVSEEAWRVEHEGAECIVKSTEGPPHSSLRRFKASGLLPGAPPSFYAHALLDSSTRLSWDKTYADILDIEPSFVLPRKPAPPLAQEVTVSLVRLLIKPVLIISGRAFFNYQVRIDYPGGAIGSVGCAADDLAAARGVACPPGYVQGEVLPGSAWHLQPTTIDDAEAPHAWKPHLSTLPRDAASGKLLAVRLQYFILTDLKGWIPGRVVNAAMTQTFTDYYRLITAHYWAQHAQPAAANGGAGTGTGSSR